MMYGALLLIALGLAVLTVRRPRPRGWRLSRWLAPRAAPAAVERQHLHLHAGGLLGEAEQARAERHFRALLDAGRSAEVERELRGGLDFAARVRALADIGTPAAAGVLERLLERPISADASEQAWYWLDAAGALRKLNRADALPAVLACADAAAGTAPGALLACEAVRFPNFRATVVDVRHGHRPSALRALVAAARAARRGVCAPAVMVGAGLSEALADVAARAEPGADPWACAAVIEADRHARRLPFWRRFLPLDARPPADAASTRLDAHSAARCDWLRGAADRLLARFPTADDSQRGAVLRCLFDLRADVSKLFAHLPDPRAGWWADAVRALRWSRSPVAGPVLAHELSKLARKERTHGRAVVVLGALCGHPGHESERETLDCAERGAPLVRAAALGALGWHPPLNPGRVVRALRAGRSDPDPDVRAAAVSALARLGERAALAEIASGLTSEEGSIRLLTLDRVAAEGLSWSWPEVEDLTGSPDADTALAAVEALATLREGVFGVGAG